jgi:hypothetical protein
VRVGKLEASLMYACEPIKIKLLWYRVLQFPTEAEWRELVGRHCRYFESRACAA